MDAPVIREVAVHNGATPLLLAADRNRVSVAKVLLAAGARDANACKANGINAMMVAAGKKRIGMLKRCLHVNDEDPGRPRPGQFAPPLVAACDNGHLEATKLLAAARASLDVPDSDGELPAMVCAREGRADVSPFLVEAKAAVVGVFLKHPRFTALCLALGTALS